MDPQSAPAPQTPPLAKDEAYPGVFLPSRSEIGVEAYRVLDGLGGDGCGLAAARGEGLVNALTKAFAASAPNIDFNKVPTSRPHFHLDPEQIEDPALPPGEGR